MKKRISPGARRAIILIQARSISRLETAQVDVTDAGWQIPFVTSVGAT